MCFVTITQHSWLFLAQKIPLSKSSFRTIVNYKMPDFYIGYTPLVGKPKIEHKIPGMRTYFRVVM